MQDGGVDSVMVEIIGSSKRIKDIFRSNVISEVNANFLGKILLPIKVV